MRAIAGLLVPYGETVPRWFGEMEFQPGAFAEFVAENREFARDVPFGADHDLSFTKVVARESNGTLSFEDRDDGLYFAASIPEMGDTPEPTTSQLDLLSMLDQELGLSLSAGAVIVDVIWHFPEEDAEDDIERMQVVKAELYEMSSVSLPAFTGARVAHFQTLPPDTQTADDPGSTVRVVTEFSMRNDAGELVEFDWRASRERALEAHEANKREQHKTTETVGELRRRYGL